MTCKACGHANPERTKFCSECGAPVAAHCGSCGSELPAGVKFCGECGAKVAGSPTAPRDRSPRDYTPRHLADKILQSKSALEGERKQVTVLFADVKGSMELAELLDPEEWHRILERFFEILTEGVHRFEGTVNQYTGDGIMALFGAPISHEDHAQRACYAALHLRDALRGYADELRRSEGLSLSTRIGINSGEVVVGKIGDDLRMDYTAQGQTVGLAQRMEQCAAADSTYLTAHTARLVKGYFQVRDLGDFELKGVSAPLRVYELQGVGALRTRLDSSRSRGFSIFVGRDREMASLESALDAAIAGHGQVVGVVADAGTGKSRLCLEFVERCRARGIRVNEAHCPAHGKTIPYLPLLEMLRDIFGIEARDSDHEVRRKIAGELLLLDESFQTLLPILFEFMGVADPAKPAPQMSPEGRQQKLFAFVRHLVQARSQVEPAVLLLDDLHWIDPGSDAFLAHSVEAAAQTRTLWLVNFRPEYHAAWMSKSFYQQLPLRPLGAEAIAALLSDLLGNDVSVAALPARIHERTGGNPFFIEEIVQSLVENGSLDGTKGAYRLLTSADALELPGTVQSVLAARLDRLPEREKRLLQTASVLGKEFSGALLESVVATSGRHRISDAELADSLAALARAEFIFEVSLYPEVEYAFKHPLTQEVAYRSLLGEQRARRHAAVARALEAERGAQGEAAAVIAYHWEGAGEPVHAARWHHRAAAWIQNRVPAEAVRHWRRVRELLGDGADTPEVAGLALAACTSLLIQGPSSGLEDVEAAAILEEGMQLARRFPNASGESRLVAAHGSYLVFRGAARDALAPLEDSVRRAGESGDPVAHTNALVTLGFTLMALGRLLPALAAVDEAVALYDSASDRIDPGEAARALLLRGNILSIAGKPGPAAESLQRGGQLLPSGNDIWLGLHSVGLSHVAMSRGDGRSAASHAERALDYAGRTGGAVSASFAHWPRGRAQLLLGEHANALHSFEQALATGALRNAEGYFLAGIALAHLGLGDHERARRTAEHAIAVAQQTGSGIAECEAQRALAQILTQTEGASAAAAIETALREVERLIGETGAHSYEPLFHEERARLAAALGDAAGRERALGEARRLFTEMGATGHFERLDREWEHL